MKVLFEKSKAKNARVQMSEAFITSVFLALSGGFQDAYTYFTRDEVFSNAQTGNVVLMSQHFMLGEWQRGLHYLIPLLAFAGGVFFADCVQGKFKYANRLHWRQGILLLEILILFGASEGAMVYALPYMMIYLLGTVASMIATGMNPFINSQGYSTVGMLSVALGAVTNLILDPIFIFVFGFGIKGAAIATILSQFLSAAFVVNFLHNKAEYRVKLLKFRELADSLTLLKNIVSLGTAGFIMQLTNSLVTICCNNVLAVTGGDLYVSVMTIVSSVRQIIETPLHSLTEGSSPILSFNYGARKPKRVKKAAIVMTLLVLAYSAIAWGAILLVPEFLIGIFSSDPVLQADAVPALKLYFAAFIFMDLQYIGQTTFKSLNKKKQAIFFSLLRKVFIVVPLTYFLPYGLHMGTNGVFIAEPVSNVVGGSLCFITMLVTILPELKRMEESNH